MKFGTRQFGAASCSVRASVQVPKDMSATVVEVSSLWCPPEQRGQRFATKLMHEICDEADKESKVLLLHVHPYGEEPSLDSTELADWYARRFGFMPIQPRPLLMARMVGATPRTLHPLAAAAAEVTGAGA